MNKFTCHLCNVTYEKSNDWTEEMALNEFKTLYPECEGMTVDVICDDCNNEFLKWFNKQTEEQKEEIRKSECQ